MYRAARFYRVGAPLRFQKMLTSGKGVDIVFDCVVNNGSTGQLFKDTG
jgi:hypothetical protein